VLFEQKFGPLNTYSMYKLLFAQLIVMFLLVVLIYILHTKDKPYYVQIALLIAYVFWFACTVKTRRKQR
jgi:lipoprotein signal peptidase